MKTILELFALAPVEQRVIPEKYYKLGKTQVVLPDLLLGLELEIEQWAGGRDSYLDTFSYISDGSLRGSSIEAVSHPTRAKYIEEMLLQFFRKHKITKDNYSDRCSTHVHMNVQDFTINNLAVLALLYQTIERLMFDFIGEDRGENIYCVPWHESGITANFVSKITGPQGTAKSTMKSWVKYTALNFSPVSTLGTVEFRHMPGTCDVERIMKWVALISCMARYAKNTSYSDLSKNILAMNTVSNYESYLREVFGMYAELLMRPGFREKLSVGVVDSKIMLIEPPKGKAPKEVDEEQIDDWPPARRPDVEVMDDLRHARDPADRAVNPVARTMAEDLRRRQAEATRRVLANAQALQQNVPLQQPIRVRPNEQRFVVEGAAAAGGGNIDWGSPFRPAPENILNEFELNATGQIVRRQR